jgi:predicted transcriptional regulator
LVLTLPDLSRKVRKQRRDAEWTQADLAKAAGVSQSLVAKLEQGAANPAYETVRRVLSCLEEAASQQEETAKELMQDAEVAEPQEVVQKALARMKKNGYSQLPVVEAGRPVGSFSERNVLEHLEAGADLEDVHRRRVRDVMGDPFPTVDGGTRRRILVELLKDREAVLVIQKGKVAGVVTRTDVL